MSLGKVFRRIAANKVEACDAARVAMEKAPDAATIIVRQRREPPTEGNRFGTEVFAIDAVADVGTATLLPRYEAYGLDALPAVLAVARARGLVVEYWNEAELLQRFEPDVPLMYRPSQPLDDALRALEGASYRLSRDAQTIAIEKDVRRTVLVWWVLTILLLPVAIVWWTYVLFQGLDALREMLVDFYVPGVRYTRSFVVAPGHVTTGDTPHERAQIVAIVRFRDPKQWWVYVGIVERDGVIGLGEAATSPSDARKLEPEQIALADVLAHVLADEPEVPYR